MTEFAGFLPGLSADEVDWQTLTFDRGNGRVEVAVPVLSDAQLGELAARVKRASRTYLKSLTVSQIIAIIDKAIARLLDRNDPYRQKAERLLPLITGYDPEMVRLGLTQYLKTFRRAELHKFLAEDFANPGILDDFQPMPKGGFAKALGPDLLVHIWAGNVPGLPLWSLISGLLVKSGTIGKVPSADHDKSSTGMYPEKFVMPSAVRSACVASDMATDSPPPRNVPATMPPTRTPNTKMRFQPPCFFQSYLKYSERPGKTAAHAWRRLEDTPSGFPTAYNSAGTIRPMMGPAKYHGQG